MAKQRRTPLRKPRRRIKTKTDLPKIYRRWPRQSLRLKKALAQAKQRFGHLPNVQGIGLGRKYCESEKRAGARPRSTLGLCVTILVHKKVDIMQLPRSECIPKYLPVNVRGSDRPVRVMTDVVTVGNNRINDDAGEEAGDDVPTMGDVRPGARHACSRDPYKVSDGPFGSGDANVGTTGAIIKMGTSIYCTTAAHTIISVSSGRHKAPKQPRRFGVKGTEWVPTVKNAFRPDSIYVVDRHIRDAFLLELPKGLAATGNDVWPSGFHGRFATDEDVTAARNAEKPTGFVWVERDGKRKGRKCFLCGASETFRRPTNSGLLEYSFVWMYRYKSANHKFRTKIGDSGAPVFIPSADLTEYRLLGLHFFRKKDIGYAVDAELFLCDVAHKLGTDFTFASLVEKQPED